LLVNEWFLHFLINFLIIFCLLKKHEVKTKTNNSTSYRARSADGFGNSENSQKSSFIFDTEKNGLTQAKQQYLNKVRTIWNGIKVNSLMFY